MWTSRGQPYKIKGMVIGKSCPILINGGWSCNFFLHNPIIPIIYIIKEAAKKNNFLVTSHREKYFLVILDYLKYIFFKYKGPLSLRKGGIKASVAGPLKKGFATEIRLCHIFLEMNNLLYDLVRCSFTYIQ